MLMLSPRLRQLIREQADRCGFSPAGQTALLAPPEVQRGASDY
jgi:hypothetical protein